MHNIICSYNIVIILCKQVLVTMPTAHPSTIPTVDYCYKVNMTMIVLHRGGGVEVNESVASVTEGITTSWPVFLVELVPCINVTASSLLVIRFVVLKRSIASTLSIGCRMK